MTRNLKIRIIRQWKERMKMKLIHLQSHARFDVNLQTLFNFCSLFNKTNRQNDPTPSEQLFPFKLIQWKMQIKASTYLKWNGNQNRLEKRVESYICSFSFKPFMDNRKFINAPLSTTIKWAKSCVYKAQTTIKTDSKIISKCKFVLNV